MTILNFSGKEKKLINNVGKSGKMWDFFSTFVG